MKIDLRQIEGRRKQHESMACLRMQRHAFADELKKRWPWVKHLFGDAAHDRRTLMDKAAFMDFMVEVVRKLEEQQGFAVQPRRRVVERRFGWLIRWRRLVRDDEQHIDVSQNMIYLALESTLLHRIFSR